MSNEHNDKNDENGRDDDQCDDTMRTARQMTSNQPRVRLMATARMRARKEEGEPGECDGDMERREYDDEG